MFSTVFVMAGAFFRYMVVLFALANKRGAGRPPSLQFWKLMSGAWSLDRRMLSALLICIALLWLLAILDVWWTYPRGGSLEKK